MHSTPAQVLQGATLPPSLRDLSEPPARLFLQGALPRGPCVGIVGTRKPTPEALKYALGLAYRFAELGVAVVSGGAEGIDAAAHQGALDAGGATLVVAPSSFDCPYPDEHGPLFARIVENGGGYVSPFATGVLPRRHQFFERNSLLVALCHVLIVVEAPLRSGARNAASWARRLQRPCFVVPSPPWNPRGLGCIAELQLGGRALGSADDVMHCLNERQLHPVATREAATTGVVPPGPSLVGVTLPLRRDKSGAPDGFEAAILSAVRAGLEHADQIGQAVGLSAAEVSHGVLLLTLQGELTQSSSGEIKLAR